LFDFLLVSTDYLLVQSGTGFPRTEFARSVPSVQSYWAVLLLL